MGGRFAAFSTLAEMCPSVSVFGRGGALVGVQTGNSRLSPQTLPATAAPGLRVNVMYSTMQRMWMCNGRWRHPETSLGADTLPNTLETVFW